MKEIKGWRWFKCVTVGLLGSIIFHTLAAVFILLTPLVSILMVLPGLLFASVLTAIYLAIVDSSRWWLFPDFIPVLLCNFLFVWFVIAILFDWKQKKGLTRFGKKGTE